MRKILLLALALGLTLGTTGTALADGAKKAGTVTYDGKDISGFKGKELLDFRRHVQPVFQNPYGSLDPMYSIYRSIEEPLRIHGIGDKKSRAKRVRELFAEARKNVSV